MGKAQLLEPHQYQWGENSKITLIFNPHPELIVLNNREYPILAALSKDITKDIETAMTAIAREVLPLKLYEDYLGLFLEVKLMRKILLK